MRDIILNKLKSNSHTLILLLLLFISAGCSGQSGKVLRFAFIGDLHYSMTDYKTTDILVQSVAKEMKSLNPKVEFLIHSGDFFHGTRGVNIGDEAAMAFNNFKRDIGMPFYIAKGNHDSRKPYEKLALPLFSRELGSEILTSYYSFDKANCHFIMLDCTAEKIEDQLLWLETDLKKARSNPQIQHIFAASHEPLWIVARAGFNRKEFSDPVASLMAKYKVDAYFCGHTHNKSVTVRLVDNRPVTQIMDAAVVEKGRLFMLAPFMNHVSTHPADSTKPGILPLEEGHQIFIPKSQLLYYWGYQEGSTTSYYVITVKGTSVQADWYVEGQGLIRSFKWDAPGKLVDLKSPAKIQKGKVAESDMKQILKAWLYAAPWIRQDSVHAPFTINGVQGGNIGMDKVRMAASPFWNKIEVPLNEAAVNAIKISNELSVDNPEGGKFGLAHIFLLVQFKDGRFAKSNISQKVLTSFNPSDGEYTNFPSKELIDSVNVGSTLKKVVLNFDRFY